jgi:UDP-N-acetylmuramoyl-L-alanyl-D-glutamate--2,6-diaminopimelate ligase
MKLKVLIREIQNEIQNETKKQSINIKCPDSDINLKFDTNINPDINSVVCDSRKVTQGSFFIAIKGSVKDGHDFIDQAIENHAAALLVEASFYNRKISVEKDYFIKKKVPFFVSSSILKDMAFLSDLIYESPQKKMFMIGVTGTNGKTTTTYLAESVLHPCVLFGTIDYRINKIPRQTGATTTPMSCEISGYLSEAFKMGIKNAVMEVSSHALCLERVSRISFDSAVFTNLTPEHLDFHKNMEEYYEAKKRFFSLLKPNGRACICIDSDWGVRLAAELMQKGIKVILFASDEKSIQRINDKILNYQTDYQTDYQTEKKSPENEKVFTFNSSLTGYFNIPNILGAFSGLLNCGLEPEIIKDRICSVKGVPGRFETFTFNGITAIVDYAHSPDSVFNVLSALVKLRDQENKKGRIITVFGCGGDRDSSKRPLMGQAATGLSDYSVITSDNPRTEDPQKIIEDILKGVTSSADRYEVVVSRKEAIKGAVYMAEKGDYIILLGKGHEDYQIIGRKKYYFDDSRELKTAFEEKFKGKGIENVQSL